jgi:5-methyltetrahydrofolate--homocysteine methyltransferase
MPDFKKLLQDGRVVLFDGAMGTLLQARGMRAGDSPEGYGAANPDVVAEVHSEYLRAGAAVVTTNTFGGSPYKLPGGLDVFEVNRSMAAAARKAAGDAGCVAGSVGPTGKFIRPIGDAGFRELVEAFKVQIQGLVRGGVDLILAETHYDLAEARAVVVACREVCGLPVGVSMTFEEGGSLTGADPRAFAESVQNMGVDMVATNCSTGPEGMAEVVRAMAPVLSVPLLAQPNAGLPELVNGATVFRLGPDDFAERVAAFVDLGVTCLGGCCGSTPEHIAALAKAVEGVSAPRPEPISGTVVLTSRSGSVRISADRPCTIIGERINPTGKKRLAEELSGGRLETALRLAHEQFESGAPVLDVNVGAPMVDEARVLPALVERLGAELPAPLCLDSSDPAAIRAALDVYPGSALVNSISGEPGRMSELGPLCKLYGAPFILLPIKSGKLPVTADERMEIIEGLLEEADALGIPRRLILVDALALTVSSKPEAATASLEVIERCRDVYGLPTVIGLSNISFGLPARELVNSSFLSMCVGRGLAAYIGNPGSAGLRAAQAAAEVLAGRDEGAERFIAAYSEWTPGEAAGPSKAEPSRTKAATLGEAVVKGAKDSIESMLEAALAEGRDPGAIVNEDLIPGITEVGDKYERREYFLPQLLASAETMQMAFARLKPLLEEKSSGEKKATVVFATVEGDIHDIGKNIVILMLRNHGFEVVDLGKDVTSEAIVEAAVEHEADVIALSALMTTTMVRMRETVELVAGKGVSARVMVGGAVLTEDYAETIGADGYARDAVGAVRLAKKLAGVGR